MDYNPVNELEVHESISYSFKFFINCMRIESILTHKLINIEGMIQLENHLHALKNISLILTFCDRKNSKVTVEKTGRDSLK